MALGSWGKLYTLEDDLGGLPPPLGTGGGPQKIGVAFAQRFFEDFPDFYKNFQGLSLLQVSLDPASCVEALTPGRP